MPHLEGFAFTLHCIWEHDAKHKLPVNECDCEWSHNLRKGPFMSSSTVCRICGSARELHYDGPDGATTVDHPYEPIDLAAASRQEVIDKDTYKNLYNEGLTTIKDMSPEQIVDNIAGLDRAIVEFRVKKYAASMRLADIQEKLTADQRKILLERSASYKVREEKVTGDITRKSSGPRAPGKTKEQKALESIMATFGWTEEQAVKFINAQKATVPQS